MRPRSPADLASFIAAAGIAAAIIPMPVETPTVPAAAEALGVSTGQIIKTLVFMVREQPVVVIAGGDRQVARGPLAARFGVGKKQVKLADPAAVLHLTGFAVGGVPPFGHATVLPALLDRGVLAWSVLYGGGGDDHSLLRITPQELARVTCAEWITLEESADPPA